MDTAPLREEDFHLLNSQESLTLLTHTLVTWYREYARDLPWRKNPAPYDVLVSETMLQQTRVDTVIPYYHRFLNAFPSPTALADADEQSVLKLWEGLGYYRRARNLQRAMQVVRDEYSGTIPDDADAVRQLPGVGPYTAGAVMSIAFNRPLAAVDGNVLRVMSRYLGIDEAIDKASTKRNIEAHVQKAIERSEPRLFTQALMELGAMVCAPRRPQCLACPIAPGCVAFATGRATELPMKTPKKARRVVTVVALWIERDGHIFVEQREDDGLLAKMWQLPAVEADSVIDDDWDELQMLAQKRLNAMREGMSSNIDPLLTGKSDNAMVREAQPRIDFAVIASERHIFTHLEWNVVVLRPIGLHDMPFENLSANVRMIATEDVGRLVWPKVYSTILKKLLPDTTGEHTTAG